jgi:hypothetical protein
MASIELDNLRNSINSRTTWLLGSFGSLKEKYLLKGTHMEPLFSEIDQVLSTFHGDFYKISQNMFENLPNDLFGVIIKDLTLIDIISLSMVCKTFLFQITQRDLFKTKSLQEFLNHGFDLEEIVKMATTLDSSKDWRWFARCISHPNLSDGLTFRMDNGFQNPCEDFADYYQTSPSHFFHLDLGLFENGKIRWGLCLSNSLGQECNWKLGTIIRSDPQLPSRYDNHFLIRGYKRSSYLEGYVEEGKRHGAGMENWKNWSYQGQYFDGKRQGFGTMKWDSGFSYKGLWKEGNPLGKS